MSPQQVLSASIVGVAMMMTYCIESLSDSVTTRQSVSLTR